MPVLKNRVSAEKKDYLDSYTIVPVTVKELWQRLLENPASEYKNTEWTCDIM